MVMKHEQLRHWCLLAAGAMVGLLGCTSQGVQHSQEGLQVKPPTRAQYPVAGDGSFSDRLAGCSFSLPPDGYRVDVTHFSSRLPADKVRHQLRIVPQKGAKLARIDIFDNPEGLGVSDWMHRHLSYLLDDSARIRKVSVGKKHLAGLVIERPRSPQAFATRTVVVEEGGRVAVITGSDVDQGERAEAFEQLVAAFSLEVAP